MDAVLQAWRDRVLAARHAREPLRLRGAGTKDFYGERVSGALLDVRSFSGIVDYEPSELVITVRCGTPLSLVEKALAEHGQYLAFEPPAFGGDPTIGGVIAAGLSGPRRIQVGAARDFVLGVRLLNAEGEVLRFGGKVMKNVAGFDVARLLCGSLGILGIMTELSIKVAPLPRAEATLRFEMSASQAVEAFNQWSGLPAPLSAAMWYAGAAWLRLSGTQSGVRAACARLGGERVDEVYAQGRWQALRDFTHPFFSASTLWRVAVPSTTPPLALGGRGLMDWAGSVRWHADEPPGVDVRALASSVGGTAMRWRGPAPDGRFHPLTGAVATIHRRLKQQFDPYGIFNPGRLVADL